MNINKNKVDLNKELAVLKKLTISLENEITKEFLPEIKILANKAKDLFIQTEFAVDKIRKELDVLNNEKNEIQNSIYTCLGRLHKIEREIGVRARKLTYAYDQSIYESEISDKFYITKVDI